MRRHHHPFAGPRCCRPEAGSERDRGPLARATVQCPSSPAFNRAAIGTLNNDSRRKVLLSMPKEALGFHAGDIGVGALALTALETGLVFLYWTYMRRPSDHADQPEIRSRPRWRLITVMIFGLSFVALSGISTILLFGRATRIGRFCVVAVLVSAAVMLLPCGLWPGVLRATLLSSNRPQERPGEGPSGIAAIEVFLRILALIMGVAFAYLAWLFLSIGE